MSAPAIQFAALKPVSDAEFRTISEVESIVLRAEQCEIATEHLFHAGMYSRTIRIPKGTCLTGALMKIATLLIVHGQAQFVTGYDGRISVSGYGVLPGSKGRKTLMVAYSDVEMTMIFPTQAKSIEEAESEFTDDADRLMSRQSTTDSVVITGE